MLTFDQNTDSLNKRIGVLDVSSTETESLHNYIYFVQGKRTDPRNYAFVGTGNWSNPANWSNELIPPSLLANGETITINPIGSTECVVDVDQTITTANTITVLKGKKIRVLKKFNIQPSAHFNLQ